MPTALFNRGKKGDTIGTEAGAIIWVRNAEREIGWLQEAGWRNTWHAVRQRWNTTAAATEPVHSAIPQHGLSVQTKFIEDIYSQK